MKSRRKHGFQFMTILYFMIVFSMCVSRFNVIMTIMGGQPTRVEEINLLPFHSVRENLQYGRNPISWDMLYNMVMFVPFGIIYCYYQKHFCVYKAVGKAGSHRRQPAKFSFLHGLCPPFRVPSASGQYGPKR